MPMSAIMRSGLSRLMESSASAAEEANRMTAPRDSNVNRQRLPVRIHPPHESKRLLRFVTPDGKELERWDESAPPDRVKNEVPPGTRIIGPNGEIIRK